MSKNHGNPPIKKQNKKQTEFTYIVYLFNQVAFTKFYSEDQRHTQNQKWFQKVHTTQRDIHADDDIKQTNERVYRCED